MRYLLSLLEAMLLWYIFIMFANFITQFFFPWEILPAAIVLAAVLVSKRNKY